jgi:predicted nucleic acid-binding protein
VSADRPSYVFDSYAVLAYMGDEPGCERVRSILQAAAEGQCRVAMSVINLGKIAYIIERERGLAPAQAALAVLALLPIEIRPATRDAVLAAAHVKANHPIAYADAFAVATALELGGVIVTGDPEFVAIADRVPVVWLAQGPAQSDTPVCG